MTHSTITVAQNQSMPYSPFILNYLRKLSPFPYDWSSPRYRFDDT